MIYTSVNLPVFTAIPTSARRILDIGCGSGALGEEVKQRQNCEVIGITYSEAEAKLASQVLDRVLVQDLNNFSPQELGSFDCIVCSHILEHLYQPQVLLQKLATGFNSEGILVVALPNILFWKQRLEFLKGHFKYQDGGLMDRTHFRFYDWKTAQELIENSGYKVLTQTSDGGFPLPGFRKVLPQMSSQIDRVATELFPGLFGLQFIFTCRYQA